MVNSLKTKENVIKTSLRGKEVLLNPYINKGVAFTQEERKELGLEGLLPPQVLTLDEQVQRAYEQFSSQPDDIMKNGVLYDLSNRNVVLFYSLLKKYLSEMMPIIYTPTVGEAIQKYSHIYHRPGGLYLSIDRMENMEEDFKNMALPEGVDLIVVTDSESILGIGDQGVGGINIAIGKLAVYTVAGGIDPTRVLPIVLDVGTDNDELIQDPLYIGNRFPRVKGKSYEQFIDLFIDNVQHFYPDALLHWEDLGNINARHIIKKYGNKMLTFNDDIQGTGAVTLAAVMSALQVTGAPLKEQRIVVFGPGSAGIGNADQLVEAMILDGCSREEAYKQFWAYDYRGLLTDDMDNILEFQIPYTRKKEEVKDWVRNEDGIIPLLEVVKRVKPHILIGTSGQKGAFTEEVVKEMAKHVERPIIMPMSNPTKLAEALPEDLIRWTEGKALIATGSPFEPVQYEGVTYNIGQANNALVFPGLGLGAIVSRAKTISKRMLSAAGFAVASASDSTLPGASLLPHVDQIQAVSRKVAIAVAKTVIEDGTASNNISNIEEAIEEVMWEPEYKTIKKV